MKGSPIFLYFGKFGLHNWKTTEKVIYIIYMKSKKYRRKVIRERDGA